MHVDVPAMILDQLRNILDASSESSETFRKRVVEAMQHQITRQERSNSFLNPRELETTVNFKSSAEDFILAVLEKLKFSAKAYHQILRVSRTIADLEKSKQVKQMHLAKALNHRRLDRMLKQVA